MGLCRRPTEITARQGNRFQGEEQLYRESEVTGRLPVARRSGTKEREDCQDPAVIVGRRLEIELGENASNVSLHGLRREEHALADGLIRTSLRHQREHFPL